MTVCLLSCKSLNVVVGGVSDEVFLYEEELSEVESLLEELGKVEFATHIHRLNPKPMFECYKDNHRFDYLHLQILESQFDLLGQLLLS